MVWLSAWLRRCVAVGAITLILAPLSVDAATLASDSQRNPLWPDNYVIQNNAAAAQVPLQFYSAIRHHQYQVAEHVLTTRIQPSYVEMGSTQYFANLQSINVGQLHDVTKQSGVLRHATNSFYAVKVYIGTVDAKSRDKTHQAQLNQLKYHRFVVVKATPTSPWQLDDDEALSPQLVKSLWSF